MIICNYYLPGYKGGGSLRTIVNTVERFYDKFDFWIVTRDHDGDNIPFNDIKINDWNNIGNAQVYYLSRDKIKISKLRELISEVSPGVIYLNSVFATFSIFVLILRKLRLLSKNLQIILAPEGEISDGALMLKKGKKKSFLRAAKTFGLYNDLLWKTTSEFEKQEAERIKGSGGHIFIAPNLTSRTFLDDYKQLLKPKKRAGEAKMVFLSRFVRKKNFNQLFEFLNRVDGQLTIDIYGNLEDENYWNETLQKIEALPKNVSVNYCGSIPHEKVPETLFRYQFFILPTLGENFGHVFVEALAAGCPLVISNRTPWRNLENKRIGWDIELENLSKWLQIVNQCIQLDDETYSNLSSNARMFSESWLAAQENESDTLIVIQAGLQNTLTSAP